MLEHFNDQVQAIETGIQAKKQSLSQINGKIQPIANQITDLNVSLLKDILPEYRPTWEWTQEEQQLVIQGVHRYGTDFSATSDLIRTKSPEQFRLFYILYREKLSLASSVRKVLILVGNGLVRLGHPKKGE